MCPLNNTFATKCRSPSPAPSTKSTASTDISMSDSLSTSCTTTSMDVDENHFDTSQSDHGPLCLFRRDIAAWVCSAYPQLAFEFVYSKIRPGKKDFDFFLPLGALKMTEDIGNVVGALRASKPSIHLTDVAFANGILSFKCSTTSLISAVLREVHAAPDYGFSNQGNGRSVIIEYSSPNIAKPFHIGHVRPTILGAFLRGLFDRSGYQVSAMNYLGDWGTQFGMIAVGFEKYGTEAKLLADPCHHLFEVYVRINNDAIKDESIKEQAAAYFKRMEDGDEVALATWRHWRELSVTRYKQDYAALNAPFDIYTGESSVGWEWQDRAIQELEDMSLICDIKGMKLVDLTKWNLEKAVLRKRDGTSIYLSRDIAEAIRRQETYGFDKMIYVVASQQDLHLAQLFKLLQLMGFEWAHRLEHVNHGLVHGMSTRKGNVIFLDTVVESLAAEMLDLMKAKSRDYAKVNNPEKVARELAITTIKIHDLSRRRIKNYVWDQEKVPTIKGDSGAYLQFTYARLVSICRQNGDLFPIKDVDIICLDNATVHRIALLLGLYPDIITRAMATYQPCGVVKYCFRLSRAVMKDIMENGLAEENVGKRRARIWMYDGARKVLGSAMSLLTLRPQDWL